MKTLFVCSLLLLTFSCKTTEQVRQESKVNDMSEQVENQSRMMAENAERMITMEGQIGKITGDLEEIRHSQQEKDQNLDERVAALESKLDEMLESLEKQREVQEEFLNSLKSIDAKGNSVKKKDEKAKKELGPDKELESSLDLFNKKKFAEAKEKLMSLMDNNKLSVGKKNKIQYALGVIAYEEKDYEKSIVYLSKIYTKFPQSSVAPGCLLYIGKNLHSIGKKAEAKESLNELINSYASSKEAKEAKTLLKKL